MNLFNGLGDSLESMADQVRVPNLAESYLAYSGQFREMSRRDWRGFAWFDFFLKEILQTDQCVNLCIGGGHLDGERPNQLWLIWPRRSPITIVSYSLPSWVWHVHCTMDDTHKQNQREHSFFNVKSHRSLSQNMCGFVAGPGSKESVRAVLISSHKSSQQWKRRSQIMVVIALRFWLSLACAAIQSVSTNWKSLFRRLATDENYWNIRSRN